MAYHEAGHAVVALHFQHDFDRVEADEASGAGRVVLPKDATPGLGLTREDLTPDQSEVLAQPLMRACAVQKAAMYLAGAEAEVMRIGMACDERIFARSPVDLTAARAFLDLVGLPASALLESRRLARAVLSERWAGVCRLADALRERGEVSRLEAATLVFG